MWRIDAGRPAGTDTENSRRHADPDVIDRTGSRARQTKRDRLSQRLRRAERRRAGHSDSDQPCPSGDGEARGTEPGGASGADLRAVWALKRAGSHTAADDGQRWLGAATPPSAHSMEQVDKS